MMIGFFFPNLRTEHHCSRPKSSTIIVVALFIALKMATTDQHPPAHHEGWMVNGQETVLYWFPVS